MSIITRDSESWIGSTLTDTADHKVGTIEEIYFDEQTDRPLWMVVKTGLFGTRHSFVPLADATEVRGAVVTPYDKREVEHAPRIDPADDLSDEQVRALYRYYGLPYDAPVDEPPAPGRETPAERVMHWLV